MKLIFRSLFIFLLIQSCTSIEDKPIVDRTIRHIRGVNITCADETVLSQADVEKWKSWKINTVRINFNKDDLLDPYSGDPKRNCWNPYEKKKKKWRNGSDG